MIIAKNSLVFIILSAILVGVSLFSVYNFGLRMGIDFTGGSIMEIAYKGARPDIAIVKETVGKAGVEGAVVQTSGTDGFLIRSRALTDTEHRTVRDSLSLLAETPTASAQSNFIENQFNSIGPVIGSELKQKAIYGIMVVVFLIVSYITFVFRKVSKPVASWKYGTAAIIALAHDIAIPFGVYAFLGLEVDVLFVTALLAILGFSIHDTIVVFDRIRENLKGAKRDETFEHTVGKSLNETFVRSINTSFTVFITLMALYILGGESTRNFSFILVVGVIAGTYSSIFLASPLLVLWDRYFSVKNS
ncbi:MAG: protein translocase subunit SecF [Patescibacteria group bacterium]